VAEYQRTIATLFTTMPKIVDHEQYRQELLSKSFHLFAAKGYAAITMRQLAEGLGVSTGTLYHYFPSKQAIFEQMMLARMERSVREFATGIAEITDIREKVAVIFQHFEREEAEAIDEVILYVEYYQHQKREGQTDNIVKQIYEQVKPEAAYMLGTDDADLIQFMFSIIDGFLFACMYDQKINWSAQAKIVGIMLEHYLNQSHSP
jgi:AcrR family transcriptional regulator